MIWGKRHDTVAFDPKEAWHKWFTWYPVRLDDGRKCWLQRVERLIISQFCFDDWVQTIVYREI